MSSPTCTLPGTRVHIIRNALSPLLRCVQNINIIIRSRHYTLAYIHDMHATMHEKTDSFGQYYALVYFSSLKTTYYAPSQYVHTPGEPPCSQCDLYCLAPRSYSMMFKPFINVSMERFLSIYDCGILSFIDRIMIGFFVVIHSQY